MTDAKEPAAIAALREVVHPTSVGTVPIVYADILQAWDTLTRERDEAVKRRREIDDEAFDYAEQIETLRTQLAAARKDAARKDAITRESAIAALVEMGAIEWTHASVSQPFVDGGFDVRYAKHVIILPTAALTQEDA